MLAGRADPDLGGSERYLDLVGVNYYPCGQWEAGTGRALDWYLRDPRRARLSDLLKKVADRYGRPLLIAETGHRGISRGEWIREVASEVGVALRKGVPLEGVCLYPIIDRPDWNNLNQWHASGLWDLAIAADGTMERQLNRPFAAGLRAAQDAVRESLHARRCAHAALPRVARAQALPRREPARAARAATSAGMGRVFGTLKLGI
jgi:hypothetical protein